MTTDAIERIQLTPEELEELTAAVRKGAAAIAHTWDLLQRVGDRLGKEWEPEMDTSVRDIMDTFASSLSDPKDAELIDPATVAESEFTEDRNWGSC